MSDHPGPSRNGRPDGASARQPASRGRWIVVLATVSALTGLGLLVASALGGLAASAAGLRGNGLLAAGFVAGVAGALGGVLYGTRVAFKLVGEPSRALLRAARAGALVGLVAAVAVAALPASAASPLLRFLAPLLPGAGAAAGEVLAGRRATSR